MSIQIAPSILSANFAILGEEIQAVSKAGADYIHIDVMDGNFVPNITFGPKVISDIRPLTNIEFDVHLMIVNPQNYIEDFVKAGADIITIHAESEIHIERAIAKIKSYGKKAGLSLVPTTHPNILEYILPMLDIVLVMTVNPGFGGQKFIRSQLEKIAQIKSMIDKLSLRTQIEVDGGITLDNVKDVINAGAEIIVAGSAIFNSNDISGTIKQFKSLY